MYDFKVNYLLHFNLAILIQKCTVVNASNYLDLLKLLDLYFTG